MTDDELMRVYVRARNGEPLAGLRAVAARARAEAMEEVARMANEWGDAAGGMLHDKMDMFAAAIRARAAEGGERG